MGGYTVATHRERAIPAVAVRRLYEGEGWWPSRSVAEIDAVLAGAPAVGAWHNWELVGFARAVIDTHLRAYIEDVVVDRAHRRRGVATGMLERVLVELGATHLVSLFSSSELAPLYRRLGFRPTRQVVMHRHPPEAKTKREDSVTAVAEFNRRARMAALVPHLGTCDNLISPAELDELRETP